MTKSTVLMTMRVGVLALGLMLSGARPVRAQVFVSPFVGYDFGGDAGCPAVTACEDRTLNAGVSIGTLGPLLGFELDVGYAKDFFGESPDYSSSVLTVMGNLMIAPSLGPLVPYGTGGLGLMKTHVELTPSSLLSGDHNHFGWNVGGGVMVFVGDHVAIRGDIRHFHAFQDLSVLGLPLGTTALDFGRASAALVFRF